eukprot:CAMPEP_0184519674 /NCGR_PEP_ID=MMETSP0198_2-20121128/6756_1 /TAXON_ID=1112570 /ORGANISM="Thraustochytrium sp., Strain LLF1b" /LENGTH=721 /DNA_ID=CAMNT_0026910213 /DNA_START=83 /DNA_END=2248 /DNA_ORIENTATION=-
MDERANVEAPQGSADDLPRGNARASRSGMARVVAVIAALAIIDTASGAAAEANAASEGTSRALSGAVELPVESYRALAEVTVQGIASLHDDNVLDWNLRHLPPNEEGTIRLHTSKSCENTEKNLWDKTKVSGNPWLSVHWRSNSNGNSAGSLDLDGIKGAYQFAANIGRTVGFYSRKGKMLACKKLQTEGFRKFGIRSKLNSGFDKFQKKKTAGEVIVNKNGEMRWILYNLGAYNWGYVVILNSGSCKDPRDFYTFKRWDSDKWGISKGWALSKGGFKKAIGKAVAILTRSGEVLACNKLNSFVERVPQVMQAAKQELKNLELKYQSEELKGSALAMVSAIQDSPMQCFIQAKRAHATAEQLKTLAGYIESKKETYAAALQAEKSGSARASKLTLIKRFEASKKRKAEALAEISGFLKFYKRTCAMSNDCKTAASALKENELTLLNANLELKNRAEEFESALAAVQAGDATEEQVKAEAEFHELTKDKALSEEKMEQLVETTDGLCPEHYSCGIPARRLKRCTNHKRFDRARLVIAERYADLVNKEMELADMEEAHQPALVAKELGTATNEQLVLIDNYDDLSAKLEKSVAKVAHQYDYVKSYDNPSPFGRIFLYKGNVLSWKLDGLPFGKRGRIMIHKGSSCEPGSIGKPAVEAGTDPFKSVFWNTKEKTERDRQVGRTEGSKDLSSLDGVLPFDLNVLKVVVVYDSNGDQVACGVLKLQ